jgi:hypothetical protein
MFRDSSVPSQRQGLDRRNGFGEGWSDTMASVSPVWLGFYVCQMT